MAVARILSGHKNCMQGELIFMDINNSLDHMGIIDKFWLPQNVIFNLYDQLNIGIS